MKTKLQNTPLHDAIIEGNIDLVSQLKDSSLQNKVDKYGFTPFDLVQKLGNKKCQKLFDDLNTDCSPLKFKVQFKGQSRPCFIDLQEFENKFQLIYRQFLTFSSYQILEDAIRNCPYLLRFEWLVGSKEAWEVAYDSLLAQGKIADVLVKWINPQMGYGVFAEEDLPEKSFVAEYTGIVRAIDKKKPDLNAYCFEYPVRFWSSKYFVIDAFHEGNISHFINHSDRPNLQPLWIVDRGLLHLVFVTNRAVSKGTQLTFDYGIDYWMHRKKLQSNNLE